MTMQNLIVLKKLCFIDQYNHALEFDLEILMYKYKEL